MKSLLSFFLLVATSNGIAQESKHLQNIRQLTFGGDNAEAYFNPSGTHLIFQSNNKAWGLECDQIFNLDIEKAANNTNYRPDMISTGEGRTTCSYYVSDNKHMVYGSTHLANNLCPPEPAERADKKYLWAIYPEF